MLEEKVAKLIKSGESLNVEFKECRQEINRDIYKTFAQTGIVIPFPQRDVHVHSQSE